KHGCRRLAGHIPTPAGERAPWGFRPRLPDPAPPAGGFGPLVMRRANDSGPARPEHRIPRRRNAAPTASAPVPVGDNPRSGGNHPRSSRLPRRSATLRPTRTIAAEAARTTPHLSRLPRRSATLRPTRTIAAEAARTTPPFQSA